VHPVQSKYTRRQITARKAWPWVIGGLVALFIIAGLLGDEEQDDSQSSNDTPAKTSQPKRESKPDQSKPENPKPAQPKPTHAASGGGGGGEAGAGAGVGASAGVGAEGASATASDCAEGYDPCVPPYPPDVDCPDVDGPVTVTGSDPHGLDADNDGVACEV
jgi:hypothetical protein